MHLCNCKFDGLILMVSLDFKTSRMMFTQRGEVSSRLILSLETTCAAAILPYREVNLNLTT